MNETQRARLRAKTSNPGILAKVSEPSAPVASAGMSDAPPARGRPTVTGQKQKERGMLRVDDETWSMLLDKVGETGKSRAEVIRDALRAWCSA